jgi:hypothetical protein
MPVVLSHKDLLLPAQGAALFLNHGLGESRRMREG